MSKNTFANINKENIEKVKILLKDKDFVEDLFNQNTIELAQEKFRAKGVEVSRDEIIVLAKLVKRSLDKGTTDITEEELQEVVGGSILGGAVGAAIAAGIAVYPSMFISDAIIKKAKSKAGKIFGALSIGLITAALAAGGAAIGAKVSK